MVLLTIDFYGYDRINNEYLIHALRKREVEQNIIIGSSKLTWSVIDSLMADKPTLLAMPGQFMYASVGVLSKLAQDGLLQDKNVFIDLHESNEIVSGHGQWWYFSEAFVRYRYASLYDYEVKEWLPIMARIVRDITHLSWNTEKKFKWAPLEKSISHLNAHPDADSIKLAATNYRNCNKSFSRPYDRSLNRLKILFSRLEQRDHCRIFVIIPPYPKSGCFDAYARLFGNDRIIDLASLNFDTTDFHDNSHLNSKGAIKFTCELNRILTTLNASRANRIGNLSGNE